MRPVFSPLSSLVILILFLLAGLFLGNFFAFVVVYPFLGSLEAIEALTKDPFAIEKSRLPLLLMQGATAFTLFLFVPYAFLHWEKRQGADSERWAFLAGGARLNGSAAKLPVQLGITFLLTFLVMPLNSLIAEWNQSFPLPEALAAMEAKAAALTEMIVSFETPVELLLGVLIIGLIPGLGEEYLFRGIVQNKVRQIQPNIHLAIWVTAFIFSAVHFQFGGLLPRMLLGALFGYLYVWSGHLAVPVFAHFVNNTFSFILMGLHFKGELAFDIEAVGQESPLGGVVLSSAFAGFLLWYFHRISTPTTVKDAHAS